MSAGWVDQRWLELRADADRAARNRASGPLATRLARHLETRTARQRRAARLVDVGAGTGAGAAWLRPRLPLAQEWRLLDRDGMLLDAAAPVRDGWARPVLADITELPAVLTRDPADAVTCQALLDLLTTRQMHSLLDPAVTAGSAVLFGLSVTGHVALAPEHPDDDAVRDAFNAHQRRAGRWGPDAPEHAGRILRSHGYHVTAVDTPWLLDATRGELTAAWLHGRAEAAADQSPSLAGHVTGWLRDRLAALRRGELTATVQHTDLLGLPPAR